MYLCIKLIFNNTPYIVIYMFKNLLASFAVLLVSSAPGYAQSPFGYVADGEAELYGYLRYDTHFRDYGVIKFATNACSDYKMLKSYGMVAGESSVFTAGTMVGDRILAYRSTYYTNVFMPEGICEIDPATGDFKMLWQYEDDGSHLILDDMTYDPKTGRAFGIHYDTEAFSTDFYEIDPKTGALTRLNTLPTEALLAIAADNGSIYGVTYAPYGQSRLVRIGESDVNVSDSDIAPEYIGSKNGTGLRAGNYSQSMEFDKTNHRLWWVAQASDGHAYLVEIDPVSGTSLSRQAMSGSPQVLALSIPYKFAADGAPSYAHSLKAEPTAVAGHDVSLSWVNPSVDYRNNQLSTITSLRLYRNSTLVTTMDNPQPGAAMTYTDQGLADGKYIYKVVPANAEGDGIDREVATFVGYDVPAAPAGVRLVASGKDATVTWTAPTTGLNGGAIDASTLKYDVVRKPDNHTVATGVSACSVSDEVKEHAGYSYVVTATTRQGRGGEAESNTVAFGPAYGIPFTSALTTRDNFDIWTPVDNNGDGQTWGFEPYESVAFYDRSEDRDADDWLVSPALLFEEGKQYQLRYTYYTTNWVTPSFDPVMEKMDVRYGTASAPESLTTVLKDLGEFHTASNTFLYGKDTFSPKGGEGYVAFHVKSEASHGRVFLKDVSLREYSSKDLSLKSFNGSATVNSTIAQTFTVTVQNEGSAAVGGYKVQLFDVNSGSVIGEANGPEVGKDQTADVPVTWVPGAEGELLVSARVVLDGDTYPADNVAATTLKVKVSPADADKWITLNNDENSGWLTPFYLDSKYYEGQCLYLEREMQKKDITVTGMQFFYNGHNTPEYTFPARVYMKHSVLPDLLQSEGSIKGAFEQSGWTKVYDGDITVGGNEPDTELTIHFDKPFKYEGGNVNIRFMIPLHDNLLDTSYHPEWHFANTTGNSRFAYFREDTDQIDNDQVYTQEYMPYIRLSYTENGSTGVITPGGETLGIAFDGTELRLGAVADRVEIADASGALVLRASHTATVGTSPLKSGVYVVRAALGARTAVRKIVVR